MTAPERDGNTTLAEAISHIRAEEIVYTRCAAQRFGDIWKARVLELTTGSDPEDWEFLALDYPDVTFRCLAMAGSAVASGLDQCCLTIDGVEVVLPELSPSCGRRWHASQATCRIATLPWPSMQTELQMNHQLNEPSGPLVADGSPTFSTFYEAAAYVFNGGRDVPGSQIIPAIRYRHQDTTGRIVTVQFGESINVALEGDRLHWLQVEVAGRLPGPVERAASRAGDRHSTVEFKIGPPPPGAWIALRERSRLVDRRQLQVGYPYRPEPGVEEVVEVDSRLEVFLAQREGPSLEFKVQVPREDSAKRNAMKTVAAFANGNGGSLVFGIDDEYNVVGVARSESAKLEDTLTRIISSWVDPLPPYEIHVLDIADDPDRQIIELLISAGTRIYCCGKDANNRRPYIRTHGLSVPANSGEIEQIVLSRTQDPGGCPVAQFG